MLSEFEVARDCRITEESEMEELKIEYRDTDSLIPYVNNSRVHNDAQVTQIASSIKEFGFTNPILVDGENGVIAGHGRLLAAKKLELKKVPVIELCNLDEVRKKAYVIADNKIAINSSWDNEILKLELDFLEQNDFDFKITGFNDAELALIFDDGSGTDANEEWKGMPEFISEDPCYRKVVVNFDTPDDVQEFFSLIGQSYTEKTKSVWFPEKEQRDLKDIRYTTIDE